MMQKVESSSLHWKQEDTTVEISYLFTSTYTSKE
jgi:hypothetical protein